VANHNKQQPTIELGLLKTAGNLLLTLAVGSCFILEEKGFRAEKGLVAGLIAKIGYASKA